jgi:polyisoprenoid-binding protein YceI
MEVHMHHKAIFISLFIVFCVSISAQANPATYDFNDPKGVNAVSIVLDSDLESMTGFAHSIKGTITIDPVERKIIHGTLTIPTSSITMTNSTMTQVLLSKPWLNAEAHPTITFVFRRTIKTGESSESKYQFIVEGDMSIGGVTKTISAPVSLTLLPGKLKDRFPGAMGDLMVLRSSFEISRKDFNINPEAPIALVSDTIQLRLNISGGCKTNKP